MLKIVVNHWAAADPCLREVASCSLWGKGFGAVLQGWADSGRVEAERRKAERTADKGKKWTSWVGEQLKKGAGAFHGFVKKVGIDHTSTVLFDLVRAYEMVRLELVRRVGIAHKSLSPPALGP